MKPRPASICRKTKPRSTARRSTHTEGEPVRYAATVLGPAKASPNQCPNRRGAYEHHRRSERDAEQMAAGKAALATSRVLRGEGRTPRDRGWGSELARRWLGGLGPRDLLDARRSDRGGREPSRSPGSLMLETATCGQCGHTAHEGDNPASLACIWPGCDCRVWILARCRGSQGRTLSGKCAGAPFTGGHDPAGAGQARPPCTSSRRLASG
jgi:hypothetical protein